MSGQRFQACRPLLAQLFNSAADTLVTMPGYGGLCSLVEVLDEVFVVDMDHVLGAASRRCLGGGRRDPNRSGLHRPRKNLYRGGQPQGIAVDRHEEEKQAGGAIAPLAG